MKKYKLLTKTKKEICGITLYQIQALKDFGNVKKGDKGGWIEKEKNLSQESNAWVYGNACVYDDAWVYGNARVYGNAWVYGDAEVYGNACVYGNARVDGDARVYGKLKLKGGYFYHYKKKTEEIEKIEIDKNYELLAKEPELGEVRKENLKKSKKERDK